MGLSSLPTELTEESYEDAFALAGSVGEVILIQRTPPWTELLAGEISELTEQTTAQELALADKYGLDLFIAIDPMDVSVGRSALADLPDELRGAGFEDEGIRDAFMAYARYIAQAYQPRYLALGVEVNSYQHEQPEDFERFVVLYHEAYEAVKEISPETLVFPTFQLEELQGLLPTDNPYQQQWYLMNRFEPRLDLLAVSSYPSLAYDTPDDIPSSYFAQLSAYTSRPIAITGMGYASDSPDGDDTQRSEPDQALFLQRTMDVAQQLSMALVVWFIGQDLSFTGDAPLQVLEHIGLRRQDGSRKEAWRVWEAASRRALQAALSEEE